MKKHTNLIQTDWRNYNALGKSAEEIKKSSEPAKFEKITSSSTPAWSGGNGKLSLSCKVLDSGSKMFPGLGKFHNNPLNINKKFKSNIKSKLALKVNSTQYDEMIEKTHSKVSLKKLHDFSTHYSMSGINRNPCEGNRFSLQGAKNRRLSIELSRVISKLAEEHIGTNIEGEDFWDCDRLAMRQITKESIFNCRMSREKHNIIMMLDSSPSCSNYANFYSDIITQCVKYGDIELYDAPNARLVNFYDSRKKSFIEFLTEEDILNNVHRWSLFKNRTIIFFGDLDGLRVIMNSTLHNKIYYFLTEDKYYFDDELKYIFEDNIPCNTKNLRVFSEIRNIKSFMAACKKLK